MTLGIMPNFNLVYLTVVEIIKKKQYWGNNAFLETHVNLRFSSSSILNEIIWQSLLN